jgi:hypothetical protein
MHLKCCSCNFRPTGAFGITLRDGCVMEHGAVGAIPHCHWPCVTNAIRHQPACGQLLDLRHSWDFSCSVGEGNRR